MYKCKVCSEMFYSHVDCDNHVGTIHAGASRGECLLVKYACTKCGFEFYHQRDCYNHGLREHGIQSSICQEIVVERTGTKAAAPAS